MARRETEDDVVLSLRRRNVRLVLLAVVLVGLFAIGGYFDLGNRVHMESVRDFILDTGVYGSVTYFAVFAIGEFLHIPGMVFVAAGILIYGKLFGFAIAYLAALFSVGFSFVLVRQIGGKPLQAAQSSWLKRTLAHLDANPIRTVGLLRVTLWMAPALNYALALTNVRFSHYLLGSAIGLLPPLAVATLFFDWMVTLL